MNRKDEHVTLALEQASIKHTSDFDHMRLVHHSLGSIDISLVDLSTKIGSIQLDVPFFINAMTGGTQWTKDINAKLAYVAKKTGIALATGSMSSAIKDESLWDTFTVVSDMNPDGVIFANINPNISTEDAQKAVLKVKAKALQIHLNAAQEVVMSEGDREFSHWPAAIASHVKHSKVDVIVKEVGMGMSAQTIEQLINLGVKIIDISGRGGTNFIQIENNRSTSSSMNYLGNWGQTTIESLLEAQPYRDSVDLIASGGIRNPLDMVKSFVLGAKAIGLSGVILQSVMSDGVEKTILMIETWQQQLQKIMALLGAKNINELRQTDYLLAPELHYYIERRKSQGDL